MSQVIPLGPGARMLTTREAAIRLGVSLRTVQLWVEAGILPAARTPGGHRRIPYNAVEALAMNMGLGAATMASAMPSRVRKPPAEPPAPHRAPGGPLRIVLVSADATWLEGCLAALQVYGDAVRVVAADNGYLGLLHIGRELPDLLITALELPGIDGLEMLRTLQRCEPLGKLRVLVLSEQPEATLRAGGGLPPSVESVSWPISPEALVTRVGRWLLSRQFPAVPLRE
ncbi:MAG: helix-turn-helix domain-containing protein [Rubrivivax sp.]|nr:MAG: helix-turn-helix domain-containing protein [Rubrivivax sp.]